MNDYKVTAGMEIHCELKTKTKMFSDSPNLYAADANTNINLIDFAYPGMLPSVNQKGIELALKAALLLNCKINKTMFFDRKNYFYPDLPKGYQITQARTPIGVGGYVEIMVDGKPKRIGIHDIHIEEDTCKSMHMASYSLLDFNRSGVPLVEIVSEPDIKSAEEGVLYLEKLREILLYADISDCKIEEGSMRCDVNVSVSQNDTLGTRTETKNVGSIKSAGLTITTEAKRQIEVLQSGGTIQEETRRYDEKEDCTILMRVKETGNDYRYFPEPDIPPITLKDSYIEEVKNSFPVMPEERRKQYKEAGIADVNIEKIIQNKKISDYLLSMTDIDLVIASNLLLGDISAYLNKNSVSLEETKFTVEHFRDLVNLFSQQKISSKQVKDLIPVLLEEGDILERAQKESMNQITDAKEITAMVQKVLDANPDSVEEFKAGKERASKFLMGGVMKESKGKVNPSLASATLMELLKHL